MNELGPTSTKLHDLFFARRFFSTLVLFDHQRCCTRIDRHLIQPSNSGQVRFQKSPEINQVKGSQLNHTQTCLTVCKTDRQTNRRGLGQTTGPCHLQPVKTLHPTAAKQYASTSQHSFHNQIRNAPVFEIIQCEKARNQTRRRERQSCQAKAIAT